MSCARYLDDAVLDHLDKRIQTHGMSHGLKQSLITSNEYFISGEQRRRDQRLSKEMQVAAVRNAGALVDDGVKVTTDYFMRQVCLPLKCVEKWCQKKEADHPNELAEIAGAWRKTKQALIDDRQVRSMIASAVTSGKNVEEQVPECKVICDEITKITSTRAKANESNATPHRAVASIGDDLDVPESLDDSPVWTLKNAKRPLLVAWLLAR